MLDTIIIIMVGLALSQMFKLFGIFIDLSSPS